MSILGLSRWNKNWNVRNSYSYVATANKIRFHFQFPRLPDAEFGGLIGWLFNWKCKFSCRIISKIANYLKYNYFWDGDGIENVTSRLWKFSYICSRHTVGVAGDDIMFHILVSCLCMSMLTTNSGDNTQKHGYLGCFHAASTTENISGVCGIRRHGTHMFRLQPSSICDSIANALELRLCWTSLSIYNIPLRINHYL